MQYELQVIVSLLKEAPDKVLYTVNNSNGFLMVREAMTQKGKGKKKKKKDISCLIKTCPKMEWELLFQSKHSQHTETDYSSRDLLKWLPLYTA